MGFSEEQSKVIEKAQEELKKIPIIPCKLVIIVPKYVQWK